MQLPEHNNGYNYIATELAVLLVDWSRLYNPTDSMYIASGDNPPTLSTQQEHPNQQLLVYNIMYILAKFTALLIYI